MDDRMTRTLEDRLDRDPKPWKPEPGDRLIGVVLDVHMRDGGYGEYPVLSIETPEGDEVELHAFHTALRNEIGNLDVRPGDGLGVRYLGEQKGSTGQKYHGYRVAIERASGDRPAAIARSVPGPVLHDEEPFPGDEVPVLTVAHAKARLLDACLGDKELARKLWGDRTEITEAELLKLENDADWVDAEPQYAPDEQPF